MLLLRLCAAATMQISPPCDKQLLSILFHSIKPAAYLHLTYNLTAEQLRRDKHKQPVSLGVSQCVALRGLGKHR